MNRTLRIVAHSLFVCIAAAFPAHAVELLAIFPENTTVVVSSPDVKRLQSLDEHAVTKVLAAPDLRKAFAPALKRWEEGFESMEKHWKDESGLSVKELRELFDGGAAFGFAFNMEALAAATKNKENKAPVTEDQLQGMIMAHFAGDEAAAEKVMNGFLRGTESSDKNKKDGEEKVEKLKFPEDYTNEVHEERGVKLHLWIPKRLIKGSSVNAWALVDKVLILTNGEKTLKACVERVQQGGASFADSAPTKELVSRVKANDIFGVAYLQPFMKMIEAQAIETFSAKAQGGAPGMPDPAKIFGWIGLSRLETGYLTLDFKDASVNTEFGVTFKEKPGIFKLFSTSGPGVQPDFLPTDATTGGYGTISLENMMGVVEEFLAETMPPVNAMVSVKLDDIRRQSGTDIKKDLLGNLGPNYWSVSGFPEEGLAAKLKKDAQDPLASQEIESQVLGFQLRDRKSFDLALTSIQNWAMPGQSMFEKSEYQGFTVQQMKGAPVGYLLTDDWFMLSVGPRIVLDKVLSRMRKGGGGEHLFSQPHVASAVKALPEGGDGTSYTDLGAMLMALAEIIKQMPSSGEPNGFIDFEALPQNLDLPLTLASRMFNEENGLRVRIHIEEKSR